MAISTNDADLLSGLLRDQEDLKVYVESHGKQLDDILSYNVIGEIKGSGLPDEVISVGGHLDSWDVGEGAHDDGSGCMQPGAAPNGTAGATARRGRAHHEHRRDRLVRAWRLPDRGGRHGAGRDADRAR